MTEHETYSFTFDKAVALSVFQQIGIRDLVLAVLAGIVPEPGWEGCVVYEGPTPSDPATTGCVGIRGPAADEVQRVLVEAFEGFDIPVPAIYEGGPEERQPIARVSSGRWAGPG
jgi:hypothetical protein